MHTYDQMGSEGVSLPWIHEHLMMPWNDLRKGDCCGHIQGISDGFYCQSCDFFVHKKCGDEAADESIEHPSHSTHTLELQSKPGGSNFCDLCGQYIVHLCYRCDMCDFDVDLHCAKFPPPEVIETSVTHGHKLTLLKEEIEFDCDANCGKAGDGFPYICYQCDLSFHVDCVSVIKHPSKYYTTQDSKEGVSLPLIHHHLMVPWNDLRKGDCCGGLEPISDGYYCRSCDFFSHKKCGEEASKYIQHPSHSIHTLRLQNGVYLGCGLCGRFSTLTYRCKICDFDIDLYCARYPPPQVMDVPETHRHKLTLVNKLVDFECAAKCGKTDGGFSYKCDECDVAFHVDCVWHPSKELKHPTEVNHSHHSLHPLKLLMGKPPDYSDGECRLCGRKVDRLFYHCSSCDFTLDMRCVLNPPPLSFFELKTHDHQLFLLPRNMIFMCNVCGLHGDRSPYVCLPCDFVIHKDCFGLPRVININRHDHRISRTCLLGVVDSVCGVCREGVDWTCGGYLCQRCTGYVVHSKCATRKDVWNGKELEGVPEEEEDTESYVVIDDNTIHHFSHKEHYLRLHLNGTLYMENKRCNACIHPIGLESFYASSWIVISFSTKTVLNVLERNGICYTMNNLL